MLDNILDKTSLTIKPIDKISAILLICTGAVISSLTAISHYYNHIGGFGFIVSIGVGVSSLIIGCLIAHLASRAHSTSALNNSDSPIQ